MSKHTKITAEGLALFVKVKQLEARIDEVEALRPHLTSELYKSRLAKLKSSLKNLKSNSKEEENINIVVTVKQ